MLDQNTDRMWFVIGAVIVGAAIIFIANGSLPTLFASVADTFKNASVEALHIIDGLQEELVDVEYHVYPAVSEPHNGYVDMSKYNQTGEIIIQHDAGVDGVYMMVDDLELKTNTEYVFSFSFQKLDGTLWGIGGHTDQAYANNTYHVDGTRMLTPFRNRQSWSESMSEKVNRGGIHEAVVRFTTPDELISNNQRFD